jgi:hypothetical protein
MTSDHTSATTTYVMSDEYLWNVSVLQRVHLFNIVLFLFDVTGVHFL